MMRLAFSMACLCLLLATAACAGGGAGFSAKAAKESRAARELAALERRAQGGDVAAMREAGIAYGLCSGCDYGAGYPCDPQKSRRWLEEAAAQGDAQAQLRLGYAAGAVVMSPGATPQDKAAAAEAARQWLLQAAAQGEGEAHLALAYGYLRDRDTAAAQRHLQAARAAQAPLTATESLARRLALQPRG